MYMGKKEKSHPDDVKRLQIVLNKLYSIPNPNYDHANPTAHRAFISPLEVNGMFANDTHSLVKQFQ